MGREETGLDYRAIGEAAENAGSRPAETPAQVAFGTRVLDCVLLDASRGGARVRLLASVDVPETATLRFSGGETRIVQRRWQRDAEVGFKVVGAA